MTSCTSITFTSGTVWPVIIAIVNNRICPGDECELCLFQRIAKLSVAWVNEVDRL
jgi:hypothetical protein